MKKVAAAVAVIAVFAIGAVAGKAIAPADWFSLHYTPEPKQNDVTGIDSRITGIAFPYDQYAILLFDQLCDNSTTMYKAGAAPFPLDRDTMKGEALGFACYKRVGNEVRFVWLRTPVPMPNVISIDDIIQKKP